MGAPAAETPGRGRPALLRQLPLLPLPTPPLLCRPARSWLRRHAAALPPVALDERHVPWPAGQPQAGGAVPRLGTQPRPSLQVVRRACDCTAGALDSRARPASADARACAPRRCQPAPVLRSASLLCPPPLPPPGTCRSGSCLMRLPRWACGGPGAAGRSRREPSRAGPGGPGARRAPKEQAPRPSASRRVASTPAAAAPRPPRCPLPSCSGWGYVLSRDLAEFVSNAAQLYAAVPAKCVLPPAAVCCVLLLRSRHGRAAPACCLDSPSIVAPAPSCPRCPRLQEAALVGPPALGRHRRCNPAQGSGQGEPPLLRCCCTHQLPPPAPADAGAQTRLGAAQGCWGHADTLPAL